MLDFFRKNTRNNCIINNILKILFGLLTTFILFECGYILIWLLELIGIHIKSIEELLFSGDILYILGIIAIGVIGQIWLLFPVGYFLPIFFRKVNKVTYPIITSLLISTILCSIYYYTQGLFRYNKGLMLYVISVFIFNSFIGSALGYKIHNKYNSMVFKS